MLVRKMADKRVDDAHPLTHPSIYSADGSCDFSLLRCGRADCGAEICGGEMYHCPLCPRSKFAKDIPSRVKDHFKKVHWENRIHEFPGNAVFVNFHVVKIRMHIKLCKVIKMRWLLM